MSLRMSLWKTGDSQLVEINPVNLNLEERLENWIEKDPSILGDELLLIGRQVITEFGGRLDLLGIDRQGDLVIIELKRGKSPREIVAQILDYASWIKDLSYTDISTIAAKYLGESLSVAFSNYFDEPLPEPLNKRHSMMIVASELDDATERIVQYLANEHGISINVVFFNFFQIGSQERIGRAWLMDPEIVQEKAEARKQPPWTGYYFVNVGESEPRNWDDNRDYGFISAGGGKKFARALKRLSVGDKIFAYMKGLGYVGYGEVTREAQMIKDFVVDSEDKLLVELKLKAQDAKHHMDNPEMSEWVVGVNWLKTFSRDEAKTFKGIFANQHIVCKLRHEATLEFLEQQFVANTNG